MTSENIEEVNIEEELNEELNKELNDEQNDEQPKEPTQPPKRGRGRPRKEIKVETPSKPKRKCTPAQLAALAEGRKKNKRFHPKD